MSILHHQVWPDEKPEFKEGRVVGENREQAIRQMQGEKDARIERSKTMANQEAFIRQEASWERERRQKEAQKADRDLKNLARHSEAYTFAQARYRKQSGFYKLFHRKITSKRAESMTEEQLNALYPSKDQEMYPVYYQAEQGKGKAR